MSFLRGNIDWCCSVINSVVETLLKNNANKAGYDGVTPLVISSQNDYVNAVEKLLKNNANPNKATNDGTTPMPIAISEQKTDEIDTLRRFGVTLKTDRKQRNNRNTSKK